MEVRGALGEGATPSAKDITSVAAQFPSQQEKERAIKLTVKELQQMSFSKLHTASVPKSIQWAVDNETIEPDIEPDLHGTFRKYLQALEALIPSVGKAGGKTAAKKGKPAPPPKPILDAFKKHCTSLGVKFEEDKTFDIINLLAAVKAKADHRA